MPGTIRIGLKKTRVFELGAKGWIGICLIEKAVSKRGEFLEQGKHEHGNGNELVRGQRSPPG